MTYMVNRCKEKLFFLLLLFPLGLTLSELKAQDGHYWTEHYGTRSILMSGSVIGGTEDLASVYYNPGRLARVSSQTFLMNADLYQLEQLKFKEALDDGSDLKSRSFGSVPGLLTGTIKLKKLPRHHFAYSALTRHRSNIDFSSSASREGDVFDGLAGNEVFEGRFGVGTKLLQEWYSLTWAYSISEKLSIGLTNSYVINSSTKSFEMLSQLLYDNNNEVAMYFMKRQASFKQRGLIWKLGLAWENDLGNFGLTITSPKLHLFGSGSLVYEDTESGLPDSLNLNHFIANYQYDLDAQHRSPASIGLGASIPFKNERLLIHLGAEYYMALKEYTIMEIEPFLGQSSVGSEEFLLYDQAGSVFNYGGGIEWNINKKLSFYSSYSSDHSYVTEEIDRFVEFGDRAANSSYKSDINHLGSGFVFNIWDSDITLGLTYSWANDRFPRPVNFPGNDAEMFGGDEYVNMTWERFRFIFSFSIPFIEKTMDIEN